MVHMRAMIAPRPRGVMITTNMIVEVSSCVFANFCLLYLPTYLGYVGTGLSGRSDVKK